MYSVGRSGKKYVLFKSDGNSAEIIETIPDTSRVVGEIDGELIYSTTKGVMSASSSIRNVSNGNKKSVYFEGKTDHGFSRVLGMKKDKLWIASASNGWDSFNLWSSDGTETGTVEEFSFFGENGDVIDFRNGIFDEVLQFGDKFFFTAEGSVSGDEIWMTDGTEAGTGLLKDLNFGPYSRFLGRIGDKLFFNALGREMWATDGTTEGTVLISETETSYQLIEYKGKALFAVSDEIKRRTVEPRYKIREIWISDGTAEGSKPLLDLSVWDWELGSFHGAQGDHFFFTVKVEDVVKTVVSDGTSLGTQFLWGEEAAVYHSFKEGDSIYFLVSKGGNKEIWKSDGTVEGTVKYSDKAPANKIRGSLYSKVGGRIFYFHRNETGTVALNLFDIVSKTQTKLMDVTYEGCGDMEYTIDHITTVEENRIFFTACDKQHGCELHTSDGTKEGTIMVSDINPGADSSFPQYFYTTPDEKTIYFNANDGVHGYELYRLDISE